MPFIRLATGALVGDRWREKGEVVEFPPRLAEAYVKAGKGIAVSGPDPIQTATAPPHGEQAVSPRQRPTK
jgi:hypothetical protein